MFEKQPKLPSSDQNFFDRNFKQKNDQNFRSQPPYRDFTTFFRTKVFLFRSISRKNNLQKTVFRKKNVKSRDQGPDEICVKNILMSRDPHHFFPRGLKIDFSYMYLMCANTIFLHEIAVEGHKISDFKSFSNVTFRHGDKSVFSEKLWKFNPQTGGEVTGLKSTWYPSFVAKRNEL